MYYLAKCLEDRNKDLFGGPVWELAVLLAKPAAGKSLEVDGVRPLSRHSLIHVLSIAEEGVPVVTCREVHLVLYGTNLWDKGRKKVDIDSGDNLPYITR